MGRHAWEYTRVLLGHSGACGRVGRRRRAARGARPEVGRGGARALAANGAGPHRRPARVAAKEKTPANAGV